MKKLLLIITLASFLGIAAFGFFGVSSSMNTGIMCVSERINGNFCGEKNPLAIATFHLDGMQEVWQVIVFLFVALSGTVLLYEKHREEDKPNEFEKKLEKERKSGGNTYGGKIKDLYKWYLAHRGFCLSFVKTT